MQLHCRFGLAGRKLGLGVTPRRMGLGVTLRLNGLKFGLGCGELVFFLRFLPIVNAKKSNDLENAFIKRL